jgi:hypothetical protein
MEFQKTKTHNNIHNKFSFASSLLATVEMF